MCSASERYDVLAIGAHPDDIEVIMGGTIAKLVSKGFTVLLVDLCTGEPARHAPAGVRGQQAARAAELLGADRITLGFQDRMIRDTPECRYSAEDRYVGSLVGVRFAEAFKARSPLLLDDPTVVAPVRFG